MSTVFIPGQGDVDFPDSMSDEQIAGVIKKQYPLLKGESQAPKERSFGEKAIGVGEAGLSALSAIPASMAGANYGVARTLVSGKFGTQEGVQEGSERAKEVSEGLTYQPKTEAGKEVLGEFGKVVGESKLGGAPIGDLQAMGAMSATKGASTIGAGGEAKQALAKAQNVVKDTTLTQAREAGYVLPPSMAKPG